MTMLSKWIGGSMLICLSLALSACGAVMAERQASEQKQVAFVQRVDLAHIWVTPDDPPSGKPFTVLGEVKYDEPFTPDAINEAAIKDKLKKMAYDKWPDTLDALVDEKTDVSGDGSVVTVSAKAIQYDSSVDRDMLHKMNEGMVASPNGGN